MKMLNLKFKRKKMKKKLKKKLMNNLSVKNQIEINQSKNWWVLQIIFDKIFIAKKGINPLYSLNIIFLYFKLVKVN